LKQPSIEFVEVLREENGVVVLPCCDNEDRSEHGERHELKVSDQAEYYDTWEDARRALTKRAVARVNAAKVELQEALDELREIQGMLPSRDDHWMFRGEGVPLPLPVPKGGAHAVH
jgi:hypothetical protein